MSNHELKPTYLMYQSQQQQNILIIKGNITYISAENQTETIIIHNCSSKPKLSQLKKDIARLCY